MQNKNTIHLNGWKRIGIVLSVLWVVGMGIKAHNDGSIWAVENAKILYDSCMKEAVSQQDFDKCWSEKTANINKFKYDYILGQKDFWLIISVLFVGPIILAWLFVYLIIGVARWIKAGFSKNQ